MISSHNLNLPIDVAAVGKNRNCPLFGSRSSWNGTGGSIDSIGTGAEMPKKLSQQNFAKNGKKSGIFRKSKLN